MSPDILIVRDKDGYRLLHGYLHLTSVLMLTDEARIQVKNDGEVKIVRSAQGYLVNKGGRQLPLLCS
jgi:hypothetical protein